MDVCLVASRCCLSGRKGRLRLGTMTPFQKFPLHDWWLGRWIGIEDGRTSVPGTRTVLMHLEEVRLFPPLVVAVADDLTLRLQHLGHLEALQAHVFDKTSSMCGYLVPRFFRKQQDVFGCGHGMSKVGCLGQLPAIELRRWDVGVSCERSDARHSCASMILTMLSPSAMGTATVHPTTPSSPTRSDGGARCMLSRVTRTRCVMVLLNGRW